MELNYHVTVYYPEEFVGAEIQSIAIRVSPVGQDNSIIPDFSLKMKIPREKFLEYARTNAMQQVAGGMSLKKKRERERERNY